MGGLLLVMDSYGHGDNFQPVFIKMPVNFIRKKNAGNPTNFEEHVSYRKKWYGANWQS